MISRPVAGFQQSRLSSLLESRMASTTRPSMTLRTTTTMVLKKRKNTWHQQKKSTCLMFIAVYCCLLLSIAPSSNNLTNWKTVIEQSSTGMYLFTALTWTPKRTNLRPLKCEKAKPKGGRKSVGFGFSWSSKLSYLYHITIIYITNLWHTAGSAAKLQEV